jgi:alkanesulfonate monooxygenase SsuD/methylene tetrahydromethanopterin reductase-like flavin-dependent oxidoreductase (luciferase family)
MHVGYAAIFQNPQHDQGTSDYTICQNEVRLAVMAESLGFDSVWGGEHHFSDYSMSPDVVQFLSYIAGACKKVKLGTMVVVLPWNDPLRVAEKIALLDCMSGGRVIFGIGRGLARTEFNGFRVQMGESRQRFIESAEMILAGLEHGYCEYDGQFIKQPRTPIRPEPFRSFRNRRYAASVSPESSHIMAKLGVGILVIPQKSWDEHEKDVREYSAFYLREQGEPAPRPYIVSWVACDKDPVRAEAMAREYIGGYWRSVVKHYELTSDHLKKIKGYEYYTRMTDQIADGGTEAMADFMMQVQVWGTPEMCYEKIRNIQARTDCCGFTGVFSYAGMAPEVGLANATTFAREVMPALKKLGPAPAFDVEEPAPPAFKVAAA